MKQSREKYWKIIKQNYILENKFIKVRLDVVKLPSGVLVNDYSVVELPSFVLVFAITKNDDVLFVREYKHGSRNVELVLPAGTYRKGEAPASAAKRELLEETGYAAKKLKHLGILNEYATKMTHTADVFLAEKVEYQGTKFKEVTEDIELVKVPLREVEKLVKNNIVRAAGSISAIYLSMLYLKK